MNSVRGAVRRLESSLGADPGLCQCKGKGRGTGWRIATVYVDNGEVLDDGGGELCSACGQERSTITIRAHRGGLAEKLCLESRAR